MLEESGNYRRLAITVLSLVVVLGFSLGSPSAQSIRTKDTISLFGNSRIDLIRENRSLQFTGIVTEGDGAYFTVQCFAEGDQLTILIPIFDPKEIEAARRRGMVRVTAWNDQGGPMTGSMAFLHDAMGIVIVDNRRLDDPYVGSALRFLTKLRQARSFFAFEVGGPTRTYDAKHLSAAWGKFTQSCDEMRASWDDFVSRL